jgi:hypothetical protein
MQNMTNGMSAVPYISTITGPPVASEAFLRTIRDWCIEPADKVRRCVISYFEGHPTMFVIGVAEEYDFALEDLIVKWDMDLHHQGTPITILQLPGGQPSLYPAFFKENTSIQVFDRDTGLAQHADSGRTSEAC